MKNLRKYSPKPDINNSNADSQSGISYILFNLDGNNLNVSELKIEDIDPISNFNNNTNNNTNVKLRELKHSSEYRNIKEIIPNAITLDSDFKNSEHTSGLISSDLNIVNINEQEGTKKVSFEKSHPLELDPSDNEVEIHIV